MKARGISVVVTDERRPGQKHELWGVGGVARPTDHCGYARRSRLAIRPKALSRGVHGYFNRLLTRLEKLKVRENRFGDLARGAPRGIFATRDPGRKKTVARFSRYAADEPA